jgi:hypothetical protein
MQRQLETKIRYAKDEQMALQAANDIIGARAARKKVVDLLAEYKKFSADCGLRPQLDRARVIGYRAIKIK